MTGGTDGVSWQAMVAYVEDRMHAYAEIVQQTAQMVRDHEREHRQAVAEAARQRRNNAAAWALVLVGAASCVGSMILDALTILGH